MRLLFGLVSISFVMSGLATLPWHLARLFYGTEFPVLIHRIESPALELLVKLAYITYAGAAMLGTMYLFSSVPSLKRLLSMDFGRRPAQVLPDGTRCLRQDSSLWALGWLAVLFGIGGAVGAAVTRGSPDTNKLIICSLLCMAFGTPYIFSGHRCRLHFDETGLRFVPPMRRSFSFAWTDVESVSFSRHSWCWRLKLTTGRKAFVSFYMYGAMEFMELLAQRTGLSIPPAVGRKGRPLENEFQAGTDCRRPDVKRQG